MKPPYINKEISWLAFNARVLQEASDSTVPLFERIKFLGIYSNNLDEFFRVRVATLKRLSKIGPEEKKYVKQDPGKILKKIQHIVLRQHEEFGRIYQLILEDLAKYRIYIVDETRLSREQGNFVKAYFRRSVRSKLIPIMIDQVDQFPDMREQSIYLAVGLSASGDPSKYEHALIEIPSDVLPRFLLLPKTGRSRHIILLDDVIRYNLSEIFSFFTYNRFEAYTVKLTRDAELDIDDDMTQSYIKKISRSLKLRKEGNPVRFIYDAQMPKHLLSVFKTGLKLDDKDAVIPGARYHNFKDFMEFPDFGLNHLKYRQPPPLSHRHIEGRKSLMAAIDERDILLHYPYQSFNYVIDLLREASMDPKVTSIQFTLYRLAKNSSVINALMNAARNGKNVVVVLELQARFDEEANIYWANRLQEEGVRVIYGVPGLKVHAKLGLIERKRKGGIHLYAMIGTGNFNEITARLYGDHILFTAHKGITHDVQRIFEFFKTNYNVSTFKHLIVSPFDLRQKLTKFIKTEIKNAVEGKEAYIFLKLNNLVDTKIIKQLYKASQVGVPVKLIVRGMFSLVPAIPGMSENIEAISIVDKYLEHTRIFVFCDGGNEKMFITSADIMTRNLDHRVEVTCPVYHEDIKQELRRFLDIQWEDNVKARIHDEDMDNTYRSGEAKSRIQAQDKIYEFLAQDNDEYVI